MKTTCKTTVRATRQSFSGAVCTAAVILLACSASAQNLFVANWYASGAGTGLTVSGSAIGCYGQSSASGWGIIAHIANSCTIGGGMTNITYKYNMP